MILNLIRQKNMTSIKVTLYYHFSCVGVLWFIVIIILQVLDTAQEITATNQFPHKAGWIYLWFVGISTFVTFQGSDNLV